MSIFIQRLLIKALKADSLKFPEKVYLARGRVRLIFFYHKKKAIFLKQFYRQKI